MTNVHTSLEYGIRQVLIPKEIDHYNNNKVIGIVDLANILS